MKNLYLLYALRFLVGGFFIFSGIIKLYPIESFELTLVDTSIIPWALSSWISRGLVAIEIFLGLGLFVNSKYLNKVLLATVSLTLFFSVYLVLLWFTRGNNVDCGCLGDLISMTPIESLIKNAILVLVLLFLMKANRGFQKTYKWIILGLAVSAIATPFILNPIQLGRQTPGQENFPYPLNVSIIPDEVRAKVPLNLEKDTYLLAFMSTTCKHCRVAARKLSLANSRMSLPSIHLFLIGPPEEIAAFQEESNSNFQYTFFKDNAFFKFCNGTLPTLIYVQNGQVQNKWYGSDINLTAFESAQQID